MKSVAFVLMLGVMTSTVSAQVFSPKVLLKGQVDTSDLAAFAQGIYDKAGASTPRQKAEAIWRFFLTDGRYVTPGFWYHIAGWAYEEPQGEVLDPLKLLNSYGFGLCYQLAPLLEAVFKAGGFEDARTWFLTGHTVTEVYYEGAYHHYDSDMLGYTVVGDGDPKALPVASVAQIAHNGNIILSKLISPRQVDKARVDFPWYPADLAEAAIGDLVSVFTSTKDNWLYGFTRYPQAHSMSFVLRPGERLIRYYQPESEKSFYLPFKSDGSRFAEFPREIAQFGIRTEDGPKSQKDNRRWATGRIEYAPVLSDKTAYYFGTGSISSSNLKLPDSKQGTDYLGRATGHMPAVAVLELQSPYVLIDARLSIDATLQDQGQTLEVSLSVDGGKSWEGMAILNGPFHGQWQAQPAVKLLSPHGELTSASGKYQVLVRLTMTGSGPADGIQLRRIRLAGRFQANPRTLPELVPGTNELTYLPGSAIQRTVIPVQMDRLSNYVLQANDVRCVSESGQSILWPDLGKTAEILFELSAPAGAALSGFDAGARFLDLRNGLAPDKLTAEVRNTSLGQKSPAEDTVPEASIAWSTALSGVFEKVWEYSPNVPWKDGNPIEQVLRWPEVDRQVRALPAETRKVYVRYRLKGMGLDSPRLAILFPRSGTSRALEITHQWRADGQMKERSERIENALSERAYRVDIERGRQIVNHAIIFYCPSPRGSEPTPAH